MVDVFPLRDSLWAPAAGASQRENMEWPLCAILSHGTELVMVRRTDGWTGTNSSALEVTLFNLRPSIIIPHDVQDRAKGLYLNPPPPPPLGDTRGIHFYCA